ncbi:DUF2207 domain-containing protein [bacterium]|nr:DUF2207 domain-containing protein [bacterium]
MHRRLLVLFPLVFFLVIIMTLNNVYADKSYQITDLLIEAQVNLDGSMRVTEYRTYKFTGSFSYAYREMPRDQGVRFHDFIIGEGQHDYTVSASGQPGTYEINEDPANSVVKWHFRASNESRTFRFNYTVSNLIQRYEDAAVLYFKFVGDEWSHSHRNVSLIVSPPVALSRDEVRVWAHGPLWGDAVLDDKGVIRASCSYIPPHTFFELRALYPDDLFGSLTSKSRLVRDDIYEEERMWSEDANRRREKAIQRESAREKRWSKAWWILGLIGLLGLGYWWHLFQQYGHRPSLPPPPEISPSIPSSQSPALVSYLLYRTVGGGGFVGVLLDLAQRGFITMKEVEEEKRTRRGKIKHKTQYYWILNREFFKQNFKKLKEFEASLLNFLFMEMDGEREELSIKEIEKNSRKLRRFFLKWQKQVKAVFNAQEWYDKESHKGMVYSIIVSIILILGIIPAVILFGHWAIILGFFGILVLVLSFFIYHRTSKGEMEAVQWKALRRYLKKYHYREADSGSLLERVNQYFVYGLVLGLQPKLFKDLAGYIPPGRYNHYIPWYVYSGSSNSHFTPETFGTAFSHMISVMSTSMSSSSGSGGGASGGGGGGASAGGGGAG